MNKEKVLLVIRDGRGYNPNHENNAIYQTPTPNTDNLMKKYPNILIDASGEAVGVPKGYQGNSEVGHMTIGSGRILYQSLLRINKSIEDKSFFQNKAFLSAIENCKKHNTSLHLMGLLQVEGVHSHIDHLFALLDLCEKESFHNVKIHVFTDGRDAPVTDSIKHITALEKKLEELGFGQIVTVIGRYYAMDRDNRWDRTKRAYDSIVSAVPLIRGIKGGLETEKITPPPPLSGGSHVDMVEAIKQAHKNGETDEFIKPMKHTKYTGIKENDSVIFFNFRTDRPRQLSKAMIEKDFEGRDREPLKIFYVGMTEYYDTMNGVVAFPEIKVKNGLGEIIANNGKSQLRISETEKYAHITFFLNGQQEIPFANEDRILIPSPRVETYDKQPEMSVSEIQEKLCEQLEAGKYDLAITNLVNGDMVGHTGDLLAIQKAITAVDDALGKIVDTALEQDYHILIFADHGNVEDQSPDWRTSHTINPVPFILVSNKDYNLKPKGGLANIAPTTLEILGIQKPIEMTGESLIER